MTKMADQPLEKYNRRSREFILSAIAIHITSWRNIPHSWNILLTLETPFNGIQNKPLEQHDGRLIIFDSITQAVDEAQLLRPDLQPTMEPLILAQYEQEVLHDQQIHPLLQPIKRL